MDCGWLVDILAGPFFSVGYPLLKTIQAIEDESETNYVELLTHWVLFSIVYLFEYIFEPILIYIPWNLAKMVFNIILVVPHFNVYFSAYLYNLIIIDPREWDFSTKIVEVRARIKVLFQRIITAVRNKWNGNAARESAYHSPDTNENVQAASVLSADQSGSILSADRYTRDSNINRSISGVVRLRPIPVNRSTFEYENLFTDLHSPEERRG